MNKSALTMARVIFGLVVSMGTKAVAQNHLISRDSLAKNMDQHLVQELIDQQILLSSQKSDYYFLNKEKVMTIFQESNDQELIQFMKALEQLVSGSSEVNIKNPNEMVLTTQDRGNLQKM